MLSDEIKQRLSSLILDELGVDLASAGVVKSVDVVSGRILIELLFGYPVAHRQDEIRQCISDALQPLPDGHELSVAINWKVEPKRVQGDLLAMDQVSNIIVVSSGKGGVGKSTTAVNLALALQAEGARVGLLDADIFGPSLRLMLGVAEGVRPDVLNQTTMAPLIAYGMQTMSMGYLVNELSPMVLRGPKASGALLQLATQTQWDALDYLVVDMPPGTSDIPLTLAQKIPVAGAVIVTTPQDVALIDACKGVEMFRKVGVGVLGVVENMSQHVCSNCGHMEPIFGEGGGARMAQRYATVLLASLPLSLQIRQQSDAGRPVVVADPDGMEAQSYRQLARRTAAKLSLQETAGRQFPKVMQYSPE